MMRITSSNQKLNNKKTTTVKKTSVQQSRNCPLMFALFLLLSTAWCGKVFVHAASPVLMKVESSATGDSSTTNAPTGIVLPPLPYAYQALEPHLGEETLRIHHDKHHAKVGNTSQLISPNTIWSLCKLLSTICFVVCCDSKHHDCGNTHGRQECGRNRALCSQYVTPFVSINYLRL